MDQKSQLKVIKAGFHILRCDDQPSPRIKVKDKNHTEWSTLEKDFASKAARDRRFEELLVSNIYISD
jgi:hypothetical protein